MSEYVNLKKQSSKNLLRIFESLGIRTEQAHTIKNLSMDASLLYGHLDLGPFKSIDTLEIFCSTGISGLTSLDLSGNLNFYKIQISGNLSNLKQITLGNPNQVPYISVSQQPEIFKLFEKARETALIKNLLTMIKEEGSPDVEQFLIGLLNGYRIQSDLKKQIKDTENKLIQLNKELRTSETIQKTTETQFMKKSNFTEMPYEISLETFPAVRLNHEGLIIPKAAIAKIRDRNTALLEKKRGPKTK